MKVKKTILKIVFCSITTLIGSSCVMDKVECKLKILNKSEKNYGYYWYHFNESDRNIKEKNERLKYYYDLWGKHQSTIENYLMHINEFNILSKIEYQTICGPKVGSGYDSIVIKYINIDSLFSNYLNNIPVDSFKGITEIWYYDRDLEKNNYKIEFTCE